MPRRLDLCVGNKVSMELDWPASYVLHLKTIRMFPWLWFGYRGACEILNPPPILSQTLPGIQWQSLPPGLLV